MSLGAGELDAARPPEAETYGMTSTTFTRWPGRARGEWTAKVAFYAGWDESGRATEYRNGTAYGDTPEEALSAALERLAKQASPRTEEATP